MAKEKALLLVLFAVLPAHAQLSVDLGEAIQDYCRGDASCMAGERRSVDKCRDESCKDAAYRKIVAGALERDFREVSRRACGEPHVDESCVGRHRARFNGCKKTSCQRALVEKLRRRRAR